MEGLGPRNEMDAFHTRADAQSQTKPSEMLGQTARELEHRNKRPVTTDRQQPSKVDAQPSGAASMWAPVSEGLEAGNINNKGEWQKVEGGCLTWNQGSGVGKISAAS